MSNQWVDELIEQWLTSIGIDTRDMPRRERLHMGFENGDRLCIESSGELCCVSVTRQLPIHDRLKVVEKILRNTSFRQRSPFHICSSMMGERVLILSLFFTREQSGLSQLQRGLDHLRKHLS